jgi:LytS/YehU family sensor histidine kinase
MLWKGSYLYHYSLLLPLHAGKSLSKANLIYADTYSLVIVLMHGSIAGIAVSLKLLRQWYAKEKIHQQLLQESTLAELQLLKAQMHPHFLFNTLNNLYSLTLKQSDHAPKVVLKLSELLHYMLHECDVATVPLQKELQVIESYIELEKLRYGKRLQINVDVKGELSGKQVPPLLLIPFVENAFKHGSSQQTGKAYIHIGLHVVEDRLLFTILNTKEERMPAHVNVGGLGLSNVKKRLALLYAQQYTLDICPEKYSYEVQLKIPLHMAAVD